MRDENSIEYIVSRYSEEKNKIQGERWGIKEGDGSDKSDPYISEVER